MRLRFWESRPRLLGVRAEAHVSVSQCEIKPPVTIGYRSYVNLSFLGNVTIGRFCSIGRRCGIGAALHPMDRLSTHPDMISEPIERPHTTFGSATA